METRRVTPVNTQNSFSNAQPDSKQFSRSCLVNPEFHEDLVRPRLEGSSSNVWIWKTEENDDQLLCTFDLPSWSEESSLTKNYDESELSSSFFFFRMLSNPFVKGSCDASRKRCLALPLQVNQGILPSCPTGFLHTEASRDFFMHPKKASN